jgi:hypothetical protein
MKMRVLPKHLKTAEMKKNFICETFILFILSITINLSSSAQNSVLVNFGSSSCADSTSPVFSFIKDPFMASPSPLNICNLSNQLPDFYSSFVAYNPKNNKIYVADIRTGATKIWILDMGLPADISCPPTINVDPDYTYSYVSNNFEFDNNGNLWSFSNYNSTLGQCNIDNLDVTTGTIISTRIVQFPAGNFPDDITSGDLTILPNGRMFATLGTPSQLYEITNYSSTTSNATATFLDSLPQSCFGIAYINGQLEITGSDFAGNCYYYKYDIAANVLDTVAKSFQAGQLPVDNTSISPSIGVTKQLVNAVKINDNSAALTYEIYASNLGNVALNNINVSDNLAAIFGAGNISNLHVSFVPGNNSANLVLNISYNGNDDTDLLIAGQNLNNQTSGSTDYFFKIEVSFTVANLDPARVYFNSAIGNATIGNAGNLSFINVSDSSNNGPQTVVDPNNDGNAGEIGENVPTPFSFSSLPVKFLGINASLENKNAALVKWTVATPTVNANKFNVEFSVDGINFKIIAALNITSANQSSYQFLHNDIPQGNLFYRVKEIDLDGKYTYSNIVELNNSNGSNGFVIFPNPANSYINIFAPANLTGKTQVIFYDAVGKELSVETMLGTTEQINTAAFPDGTYILKVVNGTITTTKKILVMHK